MMPSKHITITECAIKPHKVRLWLQ